MASAVRFETLVAEVERRRRALDPEDLQAKLRAEGLDVPIEPGDTSDSFLARARVRANQTLVGRSLGPMLGDLEEAVESLDRVLEHRGVQTADRSNPYQAAPPTSREVQILRMLRALLADCDADAPIPEPPMDLFDAREGLIIDLPEDDRPRPEDDPSRQSVPNAMWAELRSLCAQLYPDLPPGPWIRAAHHGGNDDELAAGREYVNQLFDLANSMFSRGFHDWVPSESQPGLVRKRCSDEWIDSSRLGLIIPLDEPPRYTSVVDPLDGPPPPSIADQQAAGAAEDALPEEEPSPRRGPPPGFRHVTGGANPSTNTPQSNHVAEGPDASSRVQDLFEEGRPEPHREGEPPFDSVHITRGRWTTQFAPRERHVTTGPDASGLTDQDGNARDEDEEDEDDDEEDDDRPIGPGQGRDEDEERNEDERRDEDEERNEDERRDDGTTQLTEEDRLGMTVLATRMMAGVQNAFWTRLYQRMLLDAYLLAWMRTELLSEPRFIPVAGMESAEPFLYIEATGTSTGSAFRVFQIGGEIPPPALSTPGIVLEPVEISSEVRRRIREAMRGSSGAVLDGYCLQYGQQVPPAGTAFRIADLETQAAAAPMRRILAAGRQLWEEDGLRPDSDPEAYFHSIRQWALWTAERDLDRRGFEDAFLEHTRRNFREAGREWTPEIERAVRGLVDNRWADIARILERAER